MKLDKVIIQPGEPIVELAPADRRPTRYTPVKHDRKRAEIISLATRDLNEHGMKGLVLADVAAKIGMTKANLTYYFRRKEHLAAQCFASALNAYRDMIAAASEQPTARERLADLIGRFFAQSARAARGEEAPLAILSDIRSLEEPFGSEAVEHYKQILLAAGALLGGDNGDLTTLHRTVPRAEMVLVQLFWSAAWIGQYEPDDYADVARRLNDIIADGLAAPDSRWCSSWHADAGAIGCSADDLQHGDVLRAATRLINTQGYRGASIERIAAALNATKGAIYHRFQSKDDVVLACFDRSFAQMWRIIRTTEARGGGAWQKLFTMVCALVVYQASDRGPFLRETALSSLPATLRSGVLARWNRIIMHLAALVTEGIATGEIRPVDATLAAHSIAAGVNASDEINRFIPAGISYDLTQLCVRPLLFGAFA